MYAPAHENVAQTNLQQVDLLLLALVGDGMQQARIDAPEPGQNQRVELVTLAGVGVDGSRSLRALATMTSCPRLLKNRLNHGLCGCAIRPPSLFGQSETF